MKDLPKKSGVLYLISTPIGNLEDITLRALRLLKEVSLVAAEDTRTARKIWERYDIDTPLISYHDHSPHSRLRQIISQLKAGCDIGLISEAGTPGLSDPGYDLIHQALAQEIEVVPVPGAAAFLAALVGSGLPMDRFVFEGFLPSRPPARDKRLYSLETETRTLVFYESPRRLLSTLKAMARIFGPRPAVVARELTKKFEEFIRGSLPEIVEQLSQKGVRGEVVIVLSPAGSQIRDIDPVEEVENLMEEMSISRMEAIKLVASRMGLSKSVIYRQVHNPEG